MIMISRSEILEILDTKEIKVIRATIDPRNTNNFLDGDQTPHPGNVALLLQAGDDPDDLLVIAVEDGVGKTTDPGERKIYSYDADGNILCEIHLRADGTIKSVTTGDYIITPDTGKKIGLATDGSNPLQGVVTGECLDPVTGVPFPDKSAVVFAKKVP